MEYKAVMQVRKEQIKKIIFTLNIYRFTSFRAGCSENLYAASMNRSRRFEETDLRVFDSSCTRACLFFDPGDGT